MQFEKSWLTIDNIVNIITYEADFKNYLLDIQNSYRIERAMGDDPWNKLLTKAEWIDDIISLLSNLEPAREEYFKAIKKQEEEKIQEDLKKDLHK